MNTALSLRVLYRTLALLSITTLTSLFSTHSASAININFDNSGFESGPETGWTRLGDFETRQGFQGIAPVDGASLGVLTTACPATPFPSGECFDTQNTSNFRQDDPLGGNSNRVFNVSDRDQGDANGNNFGQPTNLQTFLGLEANSLNIDRVGGAIDGTRTPKEGSAIKQTIEVTENSIISFHWNHLTNDGTHPTFGNQDYSFITIYEEGSDPSDRPLIILGDSTGDITTPIDGSQTDFLKSNNDGFAVYSSEALKAGTYVVAAGVVDVDGTGISSGLLLDNFEVVPFDFSATAGLGLVAGVFGLSRLRRRLKASNCTDKI